MTSLNTARQAVSELVNGFFEKTLKFRTYMP